MQTKADIIKELEEHKITAQEAFLKLKNLTNQVVEENGTDEVPVEEEVEDNGLEEPQNLLEMVESELVKICSEVTKMEEADISIRTNISEYGLDSIGMGIFTSKVGECYGIEINPILIMEYNTIADIAPLLVEQFAEEIAKKHSNSKKKAAKVTKSGIEKKETKVAAPVVNKQEQKTEPDKKSDLPGEQDKEFLQKMEHHLIDFKEEEICILKMSDKFEEDYVENFWARLGTGQIKQMKVSRVSHDYYEKLVSGGYHFSHLLVKNKFGKDVEVTISGKGEPLLVVGGMGMTASFLINQYRDLYESFQVVNIHMPGCGLSQDIPELSLNGIVENMMDILVKIGVKRRINLIGLSWGGMVVTAFANRYPEQTKSLILVNSIYESEVFLDISSDEMMRNDLKANNCFECYDLISKSMSLDVNMYDKYMKYLVQGTSQTHSTINILPNIDVPVLIMKSLNDKVVQPTKSDDIQKMLKEAKMVTFEHSGHFIMLSHYEKFNQTVTDFVKGEAAEYKRKPAFALQEHSQELKEFRDRASEMFGIHSLEEYGTVKEELSELSLQYILDYWKKGGVPVCAGNTYFYDELLEKFEVTDKFKKFFDYFIAVLKNYGYVEENNKILIMKKSADYSTNGKEKNQKFLEQHLEFSGLMDIVGKCGENLNAAISGKISAINVLFPEGKPDYMDKCTDNTAAFGDDKVYSTTIGRLIEIFTEFKGKGRKVRILEIGGGQGLMTREIIPVLKNPDIEYYFTDISDYILNNMERHMGLDNIVYKRFDISKDAVEQGFERESFDMIIGLDVVHATSNIVNTLINLKQLLVPGGLIALTEVINPQIWQQIIWGYAEGWWYFNDYDIRKEVPTMEMDKWRQAFCASGINEVVLLEDEPDKHFVFDSGCIIGQKDVEFSQYK